MAPFMNGDKSVTLCARKFSCCPTMEKTGDDKITIKDDFGGRVTMTKEQARMVSPAVDMLDESEQLLCEAPIPHEQ